MVNGEVLTEVIFFELVYDPGFFEADFGFGDVFMRVIGDFSCVGVDEIAVGAVF